MVTASFACILPKAKNAVNGFSLPVGESGCQNAFTQQKEPWFFTMALF